MPIAGTSHLLGKAVLAEVRASDRVLDMGTGSGLNAILAATKSSEVVAVDINPQAVEAARGNVARNGASARVNVRHSDVFSDVDGEFDLIFFGTSGDLGYLMHLARQQGFTAEVVASEHLEKDGWRVDYFTCRLTQSGVPHSDVSTAHPGR